MTPCATPRQTPSRCSRSAHRRVHLQLRSEPRVVVGAERQVMRRRLAGGDVLGACSSAISSRVEMCSTCTFARASRARRISRSVQRIAAISSRQIGMRGRIAGDAQALALDEARLVLAVEGGAAARRLQDRQHALIVGDQQRAGRGAHEHLDPGRAGQALQLGDVGDVVVRAADPEGEIAMHPPVRARELVFERVGRRSSSDWCWAFRTRPSRRRARRRASRFRDLPCG